jgi:hypothetical protein
MIGFAAERLMALETESLCAAAPAECTAERPNQRNGYRDRDWHARAGAVYAASLTVLTERPGRALAAAGIWPDQQRAGGGGCAGDGCDG